MSPPNSELLVRAVALYVPILIVLALLVQRRPDRRRVGGALVAFAWNLVEIGRAHV